MSKAILINNEELLKKLYLIKDELQKNTYYRLNNVDVIRALVREYENKKKVEK